VKTIPSLVQLPGGIVLNGLAFRVVDYNENGSPKTFELLPHGKVPVKEDHAFVLYAREEEIRAPNERRRKL
jgi:hypothetical protein